jgi:hypothetical protein
MPTPSQLLPMGVTSNSTPAEIEQMQIDAQNEADIAAAKYRARKTRREHRPKSYKNSYISKQQLWNGWCARRQFKDGNTVTDGKLLLYLEQEVIPKGNQRKGKNKGQILSGQGIEGYIRPIVELWEVCMHVVLSF